MTDATQEGVSDQIADLNDPAKHFSRAEAMNAMRARRRETVVKEMTQEEADDYHAQPAEAAPNAQAADEDSDDYDRDAALKSVENVTSAPEQPAEAPDESADTQVARQTRVLDDADLDNVRVRVKVRGEEREVTVAELRKSAQKVEAADSYLQDARAVVDEARQAAAQLRAQASPETNTNSSPASTADSSSDTSDDEALIDRAIDSLFQGDEAAAKKALREAIGKRHTTAPSVEPDQLASQVEQRMAIKTAVRDFARDHKDIVDDPIARSVANHYIGEELRARGAKALEELTADAIPDVYEAAGRATRDYFRKKAGLGTQQSRAHVASTRREAKQGIDEPRTAGTRATSSEPQPRTTTDVINRMRQSRGQPVPTT